MTIFEDLTPLVTADQTTQQLLNLQVWLQAKYPTLDINDPVLVSVWLGPLAQRLAEQANLIRTVETYSQLSVTVLNGLPINQRTELQKVLAASLGISTTPAARAVGEVRITVTDDRSIIIPPGATFSASGTTFTATSSFILRPADKYTSAANERLLRASGDNVWVGEVPLIAATPGSASNVSAGTAFRADLNIAGLRSIEAAENFIGGRDANSLQDLLIQFTNGFTARTLGSRDQVSAFLLGRDDIVPLQQLGVVGYGDVEMQRDKLPFFPVGGGKADIYVASQQYPTSQTFVLEANAARTTGSTTVFTIGIDRDRSPGYFRILGIIDNLSGEDLTLSGEVRGVDISEIYGEQVPAIETPSHGTFSRFQTSTVTATGSAALLAENTSETRAVTVRVQRLPMLDTMQTLVSDRTHRFVGGDTLVRAAAPLFMRVSIRLQTIFQKELSDIAAIREAAAAEIARKPMRSSIYQADIVQAIAQYLPPDISVVEVAFDGELIDFTGTTKRYSGVNNFDLPNSPSEQLTARTVAMYISPTDVTVSVEQKVAYHTP